MYICVCGGGQTSLDVVKEGVYRINTISDKRKGANNCEICLDVINVWSLSRQA